MRVKCRSGTLADILVKFFRFCRVAAAGSKEARELEKVKKAFEKAYRETTEIKNTAEGGVRYSLNIQHSNGAVEELADARTLTDEQALNYLKQAKSGKLRRNSYIPVRKDTPQVLIDTLKQVGEKVDNLSLVMQVRKAQQSMSEKDKSGRSQKTGKNIRGHALTPEQILEIVNSLDNPTLIVYQTERYDKNGKQLPNNVAVFVEYNNGQNEGTAVVEFDSEFDSEYIGNEYGDTNYHTVVTVFEPDTIRNGEEYDYAQELLENPNNIELKIRRRQPNESATGEKHPNTFSELPSSVNSISNSTENVKQKQLEIIEKVNPAPDTYHTWIRKVEDIKTLAETLEDSDWADGDEFNPDLTRDMIEEAIESGEITVYSSYPIEQGVFVSPSYMEAASYSGDGNVYEKTVSIDAVAWIDPTQGMYANTKENQNVQFSLSNNIEKVDEILYNKSNPLSINNRAKTNNNSSLKWVYDAEIFSVEESKLFHEKISEINTGRHSFGNNKNTLGEYMIPIENKIIFTDGNYDSPYVREIVEVLTEYQTEFEAIKERIYNVEKGKSSKQDEVQIIKQMYGDGYIISYNSGNNGVYDWQNGKRKGRTRSSVIRNHLNKQFRGRNDRTGEETPINEISPIKEASSTDDVFFDGRNNNFSLSSERTPKKYGNVYGEDILLEKDEDIAPVREDVVTKTAVDERC